MSSPQQLFHTALGTSTTGILELLPTHWCVSVADLDHVDAAGHRTDQRAQIAAHAFVFEDLRNVLNNFTVTEITVCTIFNANALMRAILAGDVAQITADALV